MSLFEVRIRTVAGIGRHGNADSLEIATLDDGSRSVVKKDLYHIGDRVVAFPEHAVLPDELLQTLGLWKDGKGLLAGSKGNRVKPIRLRGEISETLLCRPVVLDLDTDNEENLSAVLGVEKFQPKIPQIMNGKLRDASGHTVRFDIENYPKFQTTRYKRLSRASRSSLLRRCTARFARWDGTKTTKGASCQARELQTGVCVST